MLQPPQLCDFQSASYVMSFTSGSETWSRDPVVIVDTSQQVKEDIETGFTLNSNYTVTITVFMDHTNVTSSANFSMFCVVIALLLLFMLLLSLNRFYASNNDYRLLCNFSETDT